MTETHLNELVRTLCRKAKASCRVDDGPDGQRTLTIWLPKKNTHVHMHGAWDILDEVGLDSRIGWAMDKNGIPARLSLIATIPAA